MYERSEVAWAHVVGPAYPPTVVSEGPASPPPPKDASGVVPKSYVELVGLYFPQPVAGQGLLPEIELTALAVPVDLPVSLPSDLVRQRPDILSAEAQLHVASATIGVATAAMFPSISLSGTYGTSGTSFGTLSAARGRFWSIGPSATVPLFQGSTLWYGRKAAIDAFQQSQAAYRETVLSAFAQVADSLKALEHDAEALQAQVDARLAADEALVLLRANYHAGLVAYPDVLAADVQLHQAIH